MTAKYKCPWCPRKYPRDDLEQHAARLHDKPPAALWAAEPQRVKRAKSRRRERPVLGQAGLWSFEADAEREVDL